MEVLNSFEFKFADMVNKVGLINVLNHYKDDKELMYSVEIALREGLKKKETLDHIKVMDEIYYNEYMNLSGEHLRTAAAKGNPYALMEITSLDSDDEKLEKFVYSEYPGVPIHYLEYGFRSEIMTRKVIEVLKGRDDTKAIRALAYHANDIDSCRKLYDLSKDEEYLWQMARIYYRNNDFEKAKNIRPSKCFLRLTGITEDIKFTEAILYKECKFDININLSPRADPKYALECFDIEIVDLRDNRVYHRIGSHRQLIRSQLQHWWVYLI